MSLLGVRLDLLIGGFIPSPAPLRLTQALQSVEVTQTDSAPGGFQLTFHDEPVSPSGGYGLVADPLLAVGSRVILKLTLNGTPRVLMDGFITRQELNPAPGPGGTTFTVTGEDVTVKMDIFEISLPYPYMPDALIALSVLVRYAPLGIVPAVLSGAGGLIPPLDYTPQQNHTDRAFLKQMAGAHGYSFYVTPGPDVGMNIAYWGPPIRFGTPQKTLYVDTGPLSNVSQVTFGYDSLAPQITYGLAWVSKIPLPILLAGSTRFPALASEPIVGNYLNVLTNPLAFLTKLLSFSVRSSLFQHQGQPFINALDAAQSATDCSVDQVVTVQGELDTVRYGEALTAPGLVTVLGTGQKYDGLYYVKKATHKMVTKTGSWDYKQSFTLAREGLGSTL